MNGLEPGTLVGRFVILAPLGTGGMGVVHLAYDPKLDRRIALKFLRERNGDQTPRLLREAQALGRLAHPNVVAIHDVGTHDDRVWLAMEYVEGETLADWVGPGPATRLWREVLEVLRAAGRGVVAAHAAGLIHRDLKPSNIMIGRDGRVRIMDFGLVRGNLADVESLAASPADANASGSNDLLATLTRSGELLGTPAYMAPEQFLGQDVDARADQFSFCAVAWRALYGERPFAGDSLPELRHAVIHGRRRTPPRGSEVPAWLRDVLTRGLSSDPAARWPSMQALLDALASGRRRAGIRRFALAVGACALLGGSGYAYQQWDRAREVAALTAACEAEGRAIDEVWNDDARAKLEQALLATGSVLAADSWALAHERLDRYASEWTDVRTRLCMETEVEHSRDPELTVQSSSCLDERRIALVQYVDAFGRIDADGVMSAVPVLGRLDSPLECLDESYLASRPVPPPELHDRVGALRERLIRVDTLMQMRNPDAEKDAEQLVTDAKALAWPPLEAEALHRLGRVQQRLSKHEAAADNLERSLFLAAEHGVDGVAVDSASVLTYVAYERGEFAEGLRWTRIGKMILARSELDIELAEAHLHQTLGSIQNARGANDESLDEYRQALAILERRLPPDHPDIATVLQSACLVQSARREFDDAIALCRRAIDIQVRSLPSLHPERGNTFNTMGLVHLDRGTPKEALPYLTESLAISEATLPAEHPDLGFVHTNLGVAYIDSGDPAKALPEFERAIELWTKGLRPDHPLLAYPLEGKGRALTELGKLDEAIPVLEQTLAMRAGEDIEPPERAMTQYYLACALVSDPLARSRALELARTALDTLRAAGIKDETKELEAWLAEQGP